MSVRPSQLRRQMSRSQDSVPNQRQSARGQRRQQDRASKKPPSPSSIRAFAQDLNNHLSQVWPVEKEALRRRIRQHVQDVLSLRRYSETHSRQAYEREHGRLVAGNEVLEMDLIGSIEDLNQYIDASQQIQALIHENRTVHPAQQLIQWRSIRRDLTSVRDSITGIDLPAVRFARTYLNRLDIRYD